MNKIAFMFHNFKAKHCMSATSALKVGDRELAKFIVTIKNSRDRAKISRIESSPIPYVCNEQFASDVQEMFLKNERIYEKIRTRNKLLIEIYNRELSEQKMTDNRSAQTVSFSI
ncbi:hypothetical protein QTU67_002840 [Vibrio cholerae]|uniref:hypothetical protein n=1 Tax=Vibrio cholerae TaxID=666 RepID=UPI0011595FAF|nr:hypothetical protein [Vibrio cholerae]EGR0518163.1 hypothetical protein [Vibrio cholerae]EGR0543617.1 hypothetical protein [Vibrio cholerae]EGR0571285.1 hypothetical protein [Vibrio cholerae]EGR0680129.1 hypothetical protein [Vibrio cholerae]EGR5460499.1 hypothetical protein [Vibrio cholerae]